MSILARILGRGAQAAAGSAAPAAAGGGIMKTALGMAAGTALSGGAVIAGGAAMNAAGPDNWVKNAIGGWFNTGARVAAEAGTEGTFAGLYQFVELLAGMLERLGVGGGIPEAMRGFANGTAGSASNATGGPGAEGGAGGNNNDGGPGWGTAALATAGIGTVGAAGFYGARAIKNMMGGAPGLATAGVADDAYTAMQGQLGAADDVARTAGRFGRWGKIAAIGATVVGGGAALLSGSPAEASTLTSAATAAGGGLTANANNNGGSISTMGADVAGLGLSVLGGKAAATATASVAAPALASLGIKAIPGIASIYAAGEGIYNTASYALKGEWSKAGLSLVSGVGETVAGLGGAVTYLTVGTAWREAVRAGGAMAFGEENTIEHSAAVNVGSWLKDQFFGATTNTANAPAPQALAPRANAPALAF